MDVDTDGGNGDQAVLERARRTASAHDLGIADTTAGTCTFGPVDLLLHTAEGDIYVKVTETGAYHVTVWIFCALTAWGQTPDLVEVAKLLDRWNSHTTPTELEAVFPWLSAAVGRSEAGVIDAQWKWLFAVNHRPLVSVARPAYQQSALREQYPFASHGAFALLSGPVTRSTHAATFYPVGTGGWHVVGRDIDIAAQTIDNAVELVAHAVTEGWPRHRD